MLYTKYLEIPAERLDELKERLMRNCKPNLNGCWEWQLSRNKLGYGNTTCGSDLRGPAHKFSYAAFKGPVPEGMMVCHHCDNPPCINPDHLWLGTHDENQKDKMEKGRHFTPFKRLRVVKDGVPMCRKGLHALTGDNVETRKNEPWRISCKACHSARAKIWHERKKAKASGVTAA